MNEVGRDKLIGELIRSDLRVKLTDLPSVNSNCELFHAWGAQNLFPPLPCILFLAWASHLFPSGLLLNLQKWLAKCLCETYK